jgi:sugar/nucleoside kinase (ribokinase family)
MKNITGSNRNGLLGGGNWGIDQIRVIEAYPQPEQLANIRKLQQSPDGAPYNVLVSLDKLGAPFPLWGAGLVGKNPQGQAILEECRRHRIDTRYLRATPEAATACTDVMLEQAAGRRTFFRAPGANALWRGDGLDYSKIKARFFHLGCLLALDVLDKSDKTYGTKAAGLLAAAQNAGLKTSIDVVTEESDRFVRIVAPALKFTDYCILNEIEAGKTAGFRIRQPDGELDTVALHHAAGALLQFGVRELVVIHFPEGAFARTRKGEDIWQTAMNVPAKLIVSSIGAGDAFCAGMLLGLHEGWELQRCLLTGVCVAAACLSDLTSTGGIISLEAALALGKKYKFRPPLEPLDYV